MLRAVHLGGALTYQSDLQLPFQNGTRFRYNPSNDLSGCCLLVLKSGVPEHALDALRINFKSQVLVEIYN